MIFLHSWKKVVFWVTPPYTLSGPTTEKKKNLCVSSLTRCFFLPLLRYYLTILKQRKHYWINIKEYGFDGDIHTMNYPKKTGFNLNHSRHCSYITYSVKTWFLKILSVVFVNTSTIKLHND